MVGYSYYYKFYIGNILFTFAIMSPRKDFCHSHPTQTPSLYGVAVAGAGCKLD